MVYIHVRYSAEHETYTRRHNIFRNSRLNVEGTAVLRIRIMDNFKMHCFHEERLSLSMEMFIFHNQIQCRQARAKLKTKVYFENHKFDFVSKNIREGKILLRYCVGFDRDR